MEKNPEKNDKGTQPSVSLDGSKLKQVREGKKLTQLYVANVVGVTTDTISRWENNRYPSVRRDNALKLCAALEVELDEILLQEEAPAPPEAEPLPLPIPAGDRRRWAAGAVALLVIGCLATLVLRVLFAAPTSVRWAPHFAAPGSTIPIQIKIERREGEQKGFLVKETLPAGWKLVGSIPSPASVESGDVIKWLVPRGSGAVTVSYTAQVPVAAPPGKDAVLSGDIILYVQEGSKTEHIAGRTRLRIGPYHWADLTGDGRIDDDEIMPAYYICEAMRGLGLDWKTIEAIWSAKGYRWDARNGYLVVK